MSAAVGMERFEGASPRFKARVAGFFYFLLFPFGALSLIARGGIVVKGDAAATASGLLLHENAFRLSVASDLLAVVSYVVVTALFYELFKPANRSVALIAAFFSLVGCALQAFACAFLLLPFVVLGGEPYQSVFKADQLQALAYMSLKMYSPAYKIGLVFFGLYNLSNGYLILKSTFLPRFLGVFMVIAGLPFLIFLAPLGANLSPFAVAPAALGEGMLLVWLLVKGVNAERWRQQAGAAARQLSVAALAFCAAVPLFAQSTLIEQGRAAINRGDTDGAIEILEKATAQTPKSAEAHYVLGTAYGAKVQAGGMMAAARYASDVREEFEKAVALDPKSVDARYGLVQVYAGAPGIMGGSYEKAFEQAKEIKAIDPVFGHRAYAFVYSQQSKLDLANKEYADAIREEPKSGKAHSYFGQYLASVEKNYTAALSEFETALKLDPQYMPALYHLGRVASLANTNLARGEEALRQYIAYTPKPNEPTLASAHSFLGAVYEKEGKKAEAKQAYETALKLNPTLKTPAEGLKRVS